MNCKFGPTCNLNLAFGGPVNANFWIDAEKRKKMLKERADWEKKHGVTGLKLVGPSKSEQQAAKKRAEERKSNPRKKFTKPGEGDGTGSGTPAAPAVPAAPAGLAGAFGGLAIQDLDDPNFGKNVMGIACAGLVASSTPTTNLTVRDPHRLPGKQACAGPSGTSPR